MKVEKGALYWHGSRERKEIVLTEALKIKVSEIAAVVHEMLVARHMPPPVNDKRCEGCSLREACLPHVSRNSAKNKMAVKELFSVNGD